MNSVADRHSVPIPLHKGVYRRLLLAWTGILATAILYCAVHALGDGNLKFEFSETFRWAATRWGAWPILLAASYWLIRVVQSRASAGLALGLAAVMTITGASLFAYLIDFAFGGTWTIFEAAYHMTPISAATFAIFVAIGFWLLYPTELGNLTKKAVAQNDECALLPVWKGQVKTAIDIRHIESIRAARNYVEIFVGGNSYIMRTSMVELERLLPADQFLRAHRSHLVNMNLIVGLEGGQLRPSIVLRSGSRLPVGATYLDTVLETFKSRPITA